MNYQTHKTILLLIKSDIHLNRMWNDFTIFPSSSFIFETFRSQHSSTEKGKMSSSILAIREQLEVETYQRAFSLSPMLSLRLAYREMKVAELLLWIKSRFANGIL